MFLIFCGMSQWVQEWIVKCVFSCRNEINLHLNYPSAICLIELLVTTWVMQFSCGGRDSSQTGNISRSLTRWLVVHIMILCSILFFLLWLPTILVRFLILLIHRSTGTFTYTLAIVGVLTFLHGMSDINHILKYFILLSLLKQIQPAVSYGIVHWIFWTWMVVFALLPSNTVHMLY